MQATMTSKGQITVPKPIREWLHLNPGDKLEFLVDEDGDVRIVPVSGTVRQLKGLVGKPTRAVTLSEMDDAITRGASKP